VGFGANLLLSHADARRGRAALSALDFYVHADLFMTPTAALADVVLPVATPFEREALKIGFEVSPSAQSLAQLRRPVVEPRGAARGALGEGDRFRSRLPCRARRPLLERRRRVRLPPPARPLGRVARRAPRQSGGRARAPPDTPPKICRSHRRRAEGICDADPE